MFIDVDIEAGVFFCYNAGSLFNMYCIWFNHYKRVGNMLKFSLNGNWSFNKVGEAEVLPAVIPGDVYKDLLDNDKIPDPFYRDNESQLQWIGCSDWRYCRGFDLPEETLSKKRVELVCDGLDTFADVTVNGKRIASTNNMFRLWRWDITDVVQKSNDIEVVFNSTIPYIEEKQKEFDLPKMGLGTIWAGRFGWVRKQASNYGWDWGPKAVTCGIWRDIRIEAYDTARIDDVIISQDHSRDDSVGVDVCINIDRLTYDNLKAKITAEFDGSAEAEAMFDIEASGQSCGRLTVASPKLWWPNNMGEQNLYKLTIELIDDAGNVIDVCERKIGLRTLRLDRHDDQWGESFQFVVNGKPFFAKGANWIPADAVVARITDDDYRRLLQDAAVANMNMIRVWGGGIYEDEAFYDICDELGLCVWQDFMFACSTYPSFDDEFVKNVELEVEYNVKRIHHRASLALWCGNNELEQGNVAEEWGERTMSWKDYGRLFDKLLPSIVSKYSSGTDYWPGSPHSPQGDRYDFNNPTCGDAHLWSVWHGRQPFEWYRTCEHRFNSEFGFQSFPELRTIEAFTLEQDRNITSRIMEFHQRSDIGNNAIIQYMLDWFQMPVGFENTVWLSQLLQGMAMKYACEHWRRSMPRGMGTLYWQLNDNWPVASWSSIDYYGRWKALHYMARKFFNPLLISGLEDLDSNKIELHVTSDLFDDADVIARWRITDIGGSVLDSGEQNITASASANTLACVVDIEQILTERKPYEVIAWLELEHEGEIVSDNMVLLARPKHIELPQSGIETKTFRKSAGCFDVTLSSDSAVLWCSLEVEDTDAKYSDNFFSIAPGREKVVSVELEDNIDIEVFKRRLVVKNYQTCSA